MKKKGKDIFVPKHLLRQLLGSRKYGVIGLIDLLTVIDPDEILQFGIPFIRSIMEGEEDMWIASLSLFWNYFRAVYCIRYGSFCFNLHRFAGNGDYPVVINRTNNPLERLNRSLGSSFPHAHPNMHQFVIAIKDLSQDYVDTLGRIRRGRQLRLQHERVRIYNIPPGYYLFKNPLPLPLPVVAVVVAGRKKKVRSRD